MIENLLRFTPLLLVLPQIVFATEKGLDMKEFSRCDNSDSGLDLMQWNLYLADGPEGEIMRGNIILKTPQDENVGLQIIINELENENQDNPIQFSYYDNACRAMDFVVGPAYLQSFSNCEEGACLNEEKDQTSCPLNEGVYEVDNIKKSESEEYLKYYAQYLEPGDYNCYFKFIDKNRQNLGCIHMIWNIYYT